VKKILSAIKPYLRWAILGLTLFFLAKVLKDRWREVALIRINGTGWTMLAIALVITLLAHIWSGWVWTWILRILKQPVGQVWALQVYLKTNIAKYLPGNVGHFYGRISAITRAGGSLGIASISVLLEPLLMAAAALIIALISSGLGWIVTTSDSQTWWLQILCLIGVLVGVHPIILNPVIQRLNKSKSNTNETNSVQLESYPLLPLLGEMGFLILRGIGFLFAMQALISLNLSQITPLLSAFSFAWLMGLVIPGAPGGLGVFEATAVALLANQFPLELILPGVALFRLVSILAEVIAAGLAVLSEK
jgi:glycosyltransferase 2 family protein